MNPTRAKQGSATGNLPLTNQPVVEYSKVEATNLKEAGVTISPVKEEKQLNLETITWGDFTWVNIQPPTEGETKYLAQNYPFHPFDLDDCLSRKQRPKIDEYKDYLFIIIQFPVYDKATQVSTYGQLAVFVSDKYLVTLHHGQLKTLEKIFRECQTSEEARQENFHNGSGYLLYRILDRAVDSYFPILDKILSLMENIEDTVFDENVEAAKELAILRRDIITQRRIIFPLRTVFTELEGKLKRFTKIDMGVYFGDLVDHMNKICETLDECKEMIEVYKDTDYLLSSYRINRVVRVITILSSVLLPFLIVASIFGMNIVLPGGLEKGSYHSFALLMLIMSLIAVGMLYFFHRRRWI